MKIKCVFKHQDMQMFHLKLSKYWSSLLCVAEARHNFKVKKIR